MATKFEGLDNDQIPVEATTIEATRTTDQQRKNATPTEQQFTDPNKITVQVPDKNAPIIFLFGASSSGKTMTLVRLARYLRQVKGFSVSVATRFVTTKVWEYEESTKKFDKMLNTTTALPGTGRNDFLFINVCDSRGKLICQILEGAGEDYFPENGTNRAQIPFPPYMTGVFNSNNKKIWIFFTEPDWNVDQNERNEYIDRIKYCKNQFFNPKRDKSIILYNKIDTTNFVYGKGQVHAKNAWTYCDNEYTGLFGLFLNTSPLPWAEKYTCRFVPFSTGTYGKKTPEGVHYDLSADAYPERLWKTIKDCIKR